MHGHALGKTTLARLEVGGGGIYVFVLFCFVLFVCLRTLFRLVQLKTNGNTVAPFRGSTSHFATVSDQDLFMAFRVRGVDPLFYTETN